MKKIFIFISSLFLVLSVYSQTDKPLIYRINVKENIGSNTWVYLQNGMHEALQKNASCLLLHMNTYGGGLQEADSMRTAILEYPLPVYVFIDNNAASAGALISLACDSIFMKNSGSIGAATVVQAHEGTKAPDKYQSYMRAMMRTTAETHGRDTIINERDTTYKWRRDPSIAEAMVDESVVIEGYVDSTQILTLTASDAVKLGYCDGIADNINQIAVEFLQYKDYELYTYNPTFYDKLKGFLTNNIFQAFLIMFIIGGIYFELQSPGIGLPTAIAITAAILYFTPLYLTGYAQNWEVLMFVLGLILIVFEIFVIPGFGVVGISGIALVVVSLVLALIGNVRFDFNLPVAQLFKASMTVLAGLGMAVLFIIYSASRIGKKGVLKKVALSSDQEGYHSVSLEPQSLVGEKGVAITDMHPSGKVMINNEYYDAISINNFIKKGDNVVVKRYENFQLYVIRE